MTHCRPSPRAARHLLLSATARVLALGCAGALAIGCSTLPPAQRSTVADTDLAWVRSGTARTTVVFQSGLGDGMSTWAAVLARLPPTVGSFAYDRPGYGASRPAPTSPRSPCDVAQALQREAPAVAGTLSALRSTLFTAAMRAEFDGQAECLDKAPPLARPVAARILTSTRPQRGETPAFQAMVARLSADWLLKLPGATWRAVAGAGHYIHTDQPDTVAAEIRQLLAATPAAR